MSLKKSKPVIVVFSFGAELDFVFRFGRKIVIAENNLRKKTHLSLGIHAQIIQYGTYLLV